MAGSLPTRTYGPFTGGTNAVGTQVDTDLNTLYTLLQGNLGNVHIASDAAITISKLAADAWTAYVPTLYKSDGVTALTGTKRLARYTVIGKTLIGQVNFDTINDPAGPNICFDTPVVVKGDTVYTVIAGAAWTNSNGTIATGQCMTTVSANVAKLKVLLPGNGAWSTGAGTNSFFAEFTAEIA